MKSISPVVSEPIIVQAYFDLLSMLMMLRFNILSSRNSASTMMPSFPLEQPPACPICHATARRGNVSMDNVKGNAGRPYYYCRLLHRQKFVTWDDERGIAPGNPLCSCGYLSRRERLPQEHWECATSTCHMLQDISAPAASFEVSGSPAEVP